MKEAIIIIRPENFFATTDALVKANFVASTELTVLGRGKKFTELTSVEDESLAEKKDSLVMKKMIYIYIRDEDEQQLTDTIMKINSTGNSGDGKIFFVPLNDCTRIHTGEKNVDALL